MYFDVFDQINNIYMCVGDNEHTLELRLWTSRITTEDLIACMQEIVAQQHPPENIWRKPNGKQPTHRNYPDYVDKLSLPPLLTTHLSLYAFIKFQLKKRRLDVTIEGVS